MNSYCPQSVPGITTGHIKLFRRMKGRLFVWEFLLLLCAPQIRQFYPDAFFPEDNVYENKSLGFLLTFRGNWSIITDPSEMNKTYRSFAGKLQKAGAELLFMGSTVDGLYGVKAIAINLNEPPMEYARYIRDVNKSEVENDTEPVDFFAGGNPMVKWIYDKSGYRFVEFFFVVDTYDIRLSFWTRRQLFSGFLPVFEEIAATLTPLSRFD